MDIFMEKECPPHLALLLEKFAFRGADSIERYPQRQYFGYFCSYFPEELILAAGLEPLRLFPNSNNPTPAELPAFCCSLARGTLNMEIRGELTKLAGIGFAHTCDTMQCLSGVWASCGHTKTFDLVPPVMLRTNGASRYYHSALAQLLQQLAILTDHSIELSQLRAAQILCSKTRQLTAELDQLRPNLSSPLVSAILRAGQIMPRLEYNQALEQILVPLRKMTAPSASARVLVSGAVLENDSLFQMIEDLGGRVVADDTCTGYRHYAGTTFTDPTDPLSAITKRYIEMPPCPCKNQGLNERLDYLVNLALNRKAQGAIVIIRKYCDPHAWDAVSLMANLKNAGIRCLILELEGSDVGGQERTRLQAFLESLAC